MKQIKILLEKFFLFKSLKEAVEEAVQLILKEEFNISVHRNNVFFKPPILLLRKINFVVRNEINVNQRKILEKINSKLGNQDLKEIRFTTG